MKNILNELVNLDEKQLIELNGAIRNHLKFLRAAKAKAIKMSLKEGDTVHWSGKEGLQRGTVVSIKRKFAHVDVGAGTWRVPMSMLTKSSSGNFNV